jgi:peptide/nickel transport system permease protein
MTALRDFIHPGAAGRWGLALALLLLMAAVFAPWLAPADPVAENLSMRLSVPSAAHWMGTDELGRDELSRVIYGARTSIALSLSAVLASVMIGILVGAVAGYVGSWFDRLVNAILINAFLSFPGILLAIALAAFIGPGMGSVIVALVLTGWAGYARLTRAQVLQAKQMEYVLAARSLGASHVRILARHLLPNIVQPVVVQATIGLAGAILAESTLSFLGLGVLAPMPSWGSMLNDSRSYLFDAPYLTVFPALAVIIAVLAFNLLGDALRDWLDPRARSPVLMSLVSR